MTITTPVRTVLAVAALSATTAFYSCKSGEKDSDIQTAIENKKAGNAAWTNVQAVVKDGTVTLSGTVADEAAKTAAESEIKGIKGVKGVVNNLTVTPPVVDTPTPPVQVPSSLTQESLNDALKDFSTVKGTLRDSIFYLEGTISKASNIKMTQALNSLHPKKLDRSKLTVK